MLPTAAIRGLALLLAAQAPSTLNLRTAVREALDHNPEVAQSQAAVRAEAAQARGARAWPEPSISYQAWQQPLAQPLDPTATNMHMFGLRQTLPFWGQRSGSGEAAEAGARATEADAASVRLRLQAQVAHGLVGYWLMREELAAHEAHVTLGQKTLEAIKARYVGGQGTQSDLLRAETELHRLHSSIEGLRQSIRGSAAYLNATMGRRPDAPLPPPEEPERVLPVGGGNTRPEVTAAEERASQALASAALANAARSLPEVMVGFDYMLMPQMPDAYSVMVQVPLPFLSGRRAAEGDRARAQLEVAQFAKAVVENTARYEAEEARARAAAASAELEVLEKLQVPVAEHALESTRATYSAGQADLVSLLDAQNVLLDTRLLLVRQRAALGDAIADLRRALGLDLFQQEKP